MRRISRWQGLILTVFFSLALSCTPVQTPPEAPTTAPTSSTFQKVHEHLQESINAKEIAGAVALVSREGKNVYVDALGYQDLEAGTPMRQDSIFRIASMTKPITSVAVMMLYEDGLIELSDPVGDYIPRFRVQTVQVINSPVPFTRRSVKKKCTIRHLLTHTSGMTYGFMAEGETEHFFKNLKVSDGLVQTDETIGDGVERMALVPLVHEPGEQWTYGLSIDVLGYLIEVVSGMTLEEFFNERIFEPLGMKDTHFFLPPEKRARFAALYEPTSNEDTTIRRTGEKPVRRGLLSYSSSFHYDGPRRYFSGGAGLVSTVTDYARFLQMLLNGGELDGKRLLKEATVKTMTSNQIGDLDILFRQHGNKFGYGFGVLTESEKLATGMPESAGSYSWGGIFYTYFWVDPRENLFAILLCQLYPFNHMTLQPEFKSKVYEAIRRSEP